MVKKRQDNKTKIKVSGNENFPFQNDDGIKRLP